MELVIVEFDVFVAFVLLIDGVALVVVAVVALVAPQVAAPLINVVLKKKIDNRSN
jgi:hypothetical protein